MTQHERNQLQRMLADLPSSDIRLSRDRFGVVCYDPVAGHMVKVAECHNADRAELIVACLQLAHEMIAAAA